MSAWKVLRDFIDLEDTQREYRAGDDYPRPGYKPSAQRLDALSTDRNRQHQPVIAPATASRTRKKAQAHDA